MLELKVRDGDKVVVLQFEHSLLSLSKWESVHKVPFMTSAKTMEDMIGYFQDMLLSPAKHRDLVMALSPEQLEMLLDYVNSELTASTVNDKEKGTGQEEKVTSELIYYWMTALKINWKAETWHLSRLMMLIRITAYKQKTPEKRKGSEIAADYRALNAKRRAMFNTKG